MNNKRDRNSIKAADVSSYLNPLMANATLILKDINTRKFKKTEIIINL